MKKENQASLCHEYNPFSLLEETDVAKQSNDLFAFVLGHRIRNLRINNGLSQQELGLGLGSQSLISLIESGRQLPATDVLTEIGRRLNSEEILEYAKQLNNQEMQSLCLYDGSNDLLYEALIDHQNKWKQIHYDAAISLSDLYYKKRNYKFVDKLTTQVMKHTDDEFIFAKACFYKGSTFLTKNKFTESESWLKKAEKYLDPKETHLKARLMYNLAYLFTQTDNHILALWYAYIAESEFKHLNDIKLTVRTKALIGVVQRRLGRLDEAKKILLDSYELLSRLNDDLETEARIGSSLADLHLMLGEYKECETWCLTSINKGNKVGDLESIYNCYHTLSIIKWKNNDTSGAIQLLEKAIHMAESFHDSKGLAQMYLSASRIYKTPDKKLEAVSRAYDAVRIVASFALKGAVIDRLVDLYSESGKHDKAKKFQLEALDAYRSYALKNSQINNILKPFNLQSET